MITVHLLHGFNVTDRGRDTTDRLIPHFRGAGFCVRDHDYGWFGLLQVRFRNKAVAQDLSKQVYHGDIGVGHSNGCTILAQAADMGAPFRGLVFINPALEAERYVAPQVEWINIYYNAGDVPVRVAKYLWHHPWGNMGQVGFSGEDDRVHNVDCSETVNGHSDIFTKLEQWGPAIVNGVVAKMPKRRATD